MPGLSNWTVPSRFLWLCFPFTHTSVSTSYGSSRRTQYGDNSAALQDTSLYFKSLYSTHCFLTISLLFMSGLLHVLNVFHFPPLPLYCKCHVIRNWVCCSLHLQQMASTSNHMGKLIWWIFWWGLGHNVPKYGTVVNWMYQAEEIWEMACARRIIWPSLKPVIQPSCERCPHLPGGKGSSSSPKTEGL